MGGSGWSAINNTAHRALLVYQWTQDSMALLRVTTDLRRFVLVNPAVEPHIELAEAYLELLRGRPEEAVARYTRLFALESVRNCWTWLGDRGRFAEALNAVGRHREARDVCLQALAARADDAPTYLFLSRVPQQQLAIAEAQLGEHAAAAARLDALLAQPEPTDNPLLRGVLHRDRAHLALLAGDHATFEAQLRAMVRLFRESQNPALIRQCERMYAFGVKRGFAPLPSADDAAFPISASSAVAFRSATQLPDNDVSEQTEIVSGLGDVPSAS